MSAMSEFHDSNRSTALRAAVKWLSEQRVHDAVAIETACRRFDLCPADEEFLLAHFRIPAPTTSRRED